MAQTDEEKGLDGLTHAWAVTAEGEAVYRRGVCNSSPAVSTLFSCAFIARPSIFFIPDVMESPSLVITVALYYLGNPLGSCSQ